MRHAWPPGTEIEVVSVAHTHVPLFVDPTWFVTALHESALDEAREHAEAEIARVTAQIARGVPEARISARQLEGPPAQCIVEEATRWHADMIVVGTHDRTRLGRLLHPSVSRAVVRHAPCPVDVVGPPH